MKNKQEQKVQARTAKLENELAAKKRELDIEVALEKVRARTMAMHYSGELKEVVAIVFEKFRKLNFETDGGTCIVTFNAETKDVTYWAANPGYITATCFTVPYFKHPINADLWKARENGTNFSAHTYSFKTKNSFWKHLIENTDFRHLPEDNKKMIFESKSMTNSFALEKNSGMGIITYKGKKFSEEENKILKRFARTFEQAYIRFLDLQYAEAQARESQIQLALERVRARTMAMRQSDELAEVAVLLFQQVKALGVDSYTSGFTIWENDNKDLVSWMCNADGSINPPFRMPVQKNAWHKRQFESWKRQEDFIAKDFTVKAMQAYYRYLRSFPLLDEAFKKSEAAGIKTPGKQVHNIANFSQGNLMFITLQPCPEAHDIFKRFAKVFEQTYTRFLDLQKAEAQAREAQIQLAMERVRARTMAMQRSDELGDVAEILFKQVQELGIHTWTAGFNVWQEGDNAYIDWITNPSGGFVEPYTVDLTAHPVFREISDAKKRGEDFHVFELSGEPLAETYALLESFAPKQFQGFKASGFPFPVHQINHYVYGAQVGLMFITHEPCPKDWDIFKRFGKVFEQTYTRFLDLQKSEAQAKESQIQLAMERVRARTMAMQRSEELSEAATLLFQQVKTFGVSSWSCGFNIWEPDDISIVSWMAGPDETFEGALGLRLPHTEHPHFIQSYEARKRGEDFFVIEAGGKELEDTYRYMFSIPAWKKVFGNWEDSGFPVPSFQISHYVFFSQGYLLFITYEPVPEMWDIFKRFGKVFEQTYTRFLDLQKAEAQAREAKIEAGLERTRTQSMIMQHSKELDDTLRVFHQQVLLLGINSAFSFLWLPDEDKDRHIFWAAWAENNSTGFSSKAINYPLDRNEPATAQCLLDWKSNEPVYSYHVPPVAVENYFAVWSELIAGVEQLKPEYFKEGLYYVEAFMKYGCFGVIVRSELKEDEKRILARFAVEFERTYTRFLDLQKAEAQAREARIENALEKVRSRTMAMQQSAELAEVATVLFQQVKALGVPQWTCGFSIFEIDDNEFTWYPGSADGEILPPNKIPLTEHPVFISFNESRKRDEEFFVYEKGGEFQADHYRYMRSLPGGEEMYQNELKAGLIFPAFQIDHIANFSHGNLVFITYEHFPEMHDVFKRFAKVFDQTYTRFLDLQKSEAQAREAQIEAALERVRSRTMGMQKSDELREVIQVIYEQMVGLNIKVDGAGFAIDFRESDDWNIWNADAYTQFPTKIHIPYFDHRVANAIIEAKNSGVELVPLKLTVEERNTLLDHVFKYAPASPEAKEVVYNTPGFAESDVLLKNVLLFIHNYAGIPYTDAENAIFIRFGKVFEQAYTRFKDLEKAETQAREAKIEAALERTRIQSMLMQHSSELDTTLRIFHQQLDLLGIISHFIFLWLPEEDRDEHIFWTTWPEDLPSPKESFVTEQTGKDGSISIQSKKLTYPLDRNEPYTAECLAAWKSGEPIHTYFFPPAEVENYFATWKELLSGSEKMKPEFFPAGLDLVEVYMKYGCFGVYVHRLLTEDEKLILRRFTIEFERTYTRFLDLQKAEAQVREAQIQLALERVRARTMAMQKSTELGETSFLLFEQFRELGDNADQVTIGIINEKEMTAEMSATVHGHQLLQTNVSLQEPIVMIKILEAWKAKQSFVVVDVSGKLLREYNQYRNRLRGEKLFSENAGPDDHWYVHAAFFSKGLLSFSSIHPQPAETLQLLERFAGVFDLTYTRFLDLKNAEGQAREAQIEAALERVRSRSMGMQKSAELKEVIQVVYDQFVHLNIKIEHTGFVIDYKARDDYDLWIADPLGVPSRVIVPYFDCAYYNRFNEAKEKGEDFFATSLDFEEKNKFYQELFEYVPGLPEEAKKFYFNCPGLAVSTVLLDNVCLYIENFSGIPYSDEENKTLMRFGKVFQQTYTRFLDLQKAEEQAREAQIETALERVRSRSMGMQKSEELRDVIQVIYEQFVHLNIQINTVGFILDYKESDDLNFWIANKMGAPTKQQYPYFDSLHWNLFIEAKQNGLDFFADTLTFEEKNKFFKQIFGYTPGFPEEAKDFFYSSPGWASSNVLLKNVCLFIDNLDGIPFADADNATLMRFGKVFQQTYTRFLDLQKAEAQTKEAQIEAALERVRSRSMGMQKSEELRDVIQIIFNQLIHLNFSVSNAGFAMDYKKSDDFDVWMADAHAEFPSRIHIPYFDHPAFHAIIEARNKGLDFLTFSLSFEQKNKWIDHFLQFYPAIEQETKAIVYSAPGLAQSSVLMDNVALYINNLSGIPFTEEENSTIRRFGKVFEQTYTRFNDLNKAEAQVRETQIEAALERVRSRSMGMQKSDELRVVMQVILEQLLHLDFNIDAAGFLVDYRDSNDFNTWIADRFLTYPQKIHNPYFDNPMFNRFIDAKENGLEFYTNRLTFAEKNRYWDHSLKYIPNVTEEVKEVFYRAPGLLISNVLLKNIALYVVNLACIPYTDAENATLMRFGKVFEQSYTRFSDLKQAETQAREARIEASLERVRGKAMAMHSSKDLAETISVFYRELKLLSVTPRRCGVALVDKESRVAELATMNTTEQGDSVEIVGRLKMMGHWVLDEIFDHWLLQEEYHVVLRGNEIKEYYQVVRPQILYPDYPHDVVQFGYYFMFNEGDVYAWTDKELEERDLQIYRRFTTVLSLTYKRYKDLKDAEARTKDALKLAALDRIRADIASMRTISDLERITPLIWNELTTLGVPFLRCGVFIMDEELQKVHTFLSTPEGEAIATLHVPFEFNLSIITNAVSHWFKKKMYTEYWDAAAFTNSWIALSSLRESSGGSHQHEQAPENLYLHLLPFLQGMLYVGNDTPLNEVELQLVQNLADAFSTAYARYEDFSKLEAAKMQVDSTLNELQATQKQLIQSEKMASLGELTAGIAHEIQNPLNFVNNFSEVNKELLAELNEEIEKGNYEEVKMIAADIAGNEEKISHHGKRADSIVKGMLQHSRSTSNAKEPTDINILADEYLRLAYHGLRAKDKSFNATMNTSFDDSIGKINIIPQDIGRVLLNLYNNAFYAASLPPPDGGGFKDPHYKHEPTVWVSTKKEGDKVVISVKDNGPGIPERILDKIFQPFFTTKPTGQGTGLGLSLAYDIVKAHGGEMKVETKEGGGSEFIILLPVV